MRLPHVIAIDGTAGSGKGTTALMLADELGFHSLDSGVLYRAVALKAIQTGVDATNADVVAALVPQLGISFAGNSVRLRNVDVTKKLREPRVEELTRNIAKFRGVRLALRGLQLSRRKPPGLVTDGRNQCWLFSPECEECTFGFYFDAPVAVRAQRIAKRRVAQGQENVQYDEVLAEIVARDEADKARTESPLRMHPNAIPVSNVGMTPSQATKFVLRNYRRMVKERGL